MIRHAGLIARFETEGWRGVLIEGQAGAGKSDLILRLLDAGWSLVADDRVVVWASGGRLYGRAPPPLAGLLEIRGLDVTPVPYRGFAPIALAARCVERALIERLPEPQAISLSGLSLPVVDLVAREASAPAKLAWALSHLGLRV